MGGGSKYTGTCKAITNGDELGHVRKIFEGGRRVEKLLICVRSPVFV